MNSFDAGIIHFLNAFANRSPALDSLLVVMSHNLLLQGGVIVVLFWWALVQVRKKGPNERELLLFGLFASVFAVFVARILALALPFRQRPLFNPLLDFKPPYSMNANGLIGWSSFPSDHAVVFFCLAMSVWLASKRLGASALAYAALGVSFPRIYLGIHYPTDILAGAALGIGVACLGKSDRIRNVIVHPMLYWQEWHPASFTAFPFFLSFEIAEEFNSIRTLGLVSYQGAKGVMQALR